ARARKRAIRRPFMSEASPRPWLPRLLFGLTLGLAGALLLAVVLAPWLDDGTPHPPGGGSVLAVFAHDSVVRRTAVGAVVGLLVTAFVFFRQPGGKRGPSRPAARPRNIAGA